MLEFFFGMFAGSVIVGGISEYRLDRREIDHLIALSEAKSDAFLDGFRHASRGVKGKTE